MKERAVVLIEPETCVGMNERPWREGHDRTLPITGTTHVHRQPVSCDVFANARRVPPGLPSFPTPGAHGPVHLYGWNPRTRAPIWFGRPVLPNPEHHRTAWPSGTGSRRHRAALRDGFLPQPLAQAQLTPPGEYKRN
jgi:hypothetical protein